MNETGDRDESAMDINSRYVITLVSGREIVSDWEKLSIVADAMENIRKAHGFDGAVLRVWLNGQLTLFNLTQVAFVSQENR